MIMSAMGDLVAGKCFAKSIGVHFLVVVSAAVLSAPAARSALMTPGELRQAADMSDVYL